ncbi:hypothetical protein T02_14907 [Trichinella nativa]|uniref:Uncharacterized protein n=2 Tax=Trichinella TaxID=6333 RepID=A0A0V1LB97_9BILA|nr:hypothetical protein T05_7563 [Trichinella murrelli]KRZ56831.1 hypothetical protein T02_14907 [Trichinella nativa]
MKLNFPCEKEVLANCLFETINACACVFFFLCHMFKACRFQSVSQLIVEALFVEALGLLVVVRQVSTYL